ncbi:outer membrane protein [Flammeovirgaceae bacterium 311]|nr:outer membrane protein [Flammeovirgaceae bacterium 311]
MKPIKAYWLLVLAYLWYPGLLIAQHTGENAAKGTFTLEECIDYAFEHQPAIRQSQIDEAIGEREINAALSSWLPQVTAGFGYTYNIQRQVAVFGDQPIQIGTRNNSSLQLQASQVLYSNDVLLASRGARFTRRSLDQSTTFTRINTVVEVSKAFYDLLLTREQLKILDENIARLEKQYRDARSQYESGIVDKTDYQRASITLANTRSDRKRTQEAIKARYAYLKQLMGYPANQELDIAHDYESMQAQIQADTIQLVQYENRIEYQLLQTQQQLLGLNTSYHRWGFLPTVSATYNNSRLFLNDEFSQLYNIAYPTSAAGLQVAIPIFQGTRRIQNMKRAQLLEQRLQQDLLETQNAINTEYQRALANYKSDYNEWLTLQQNVEIAEEVYDIIKLQYDEGIKTYLDLIVAETDLRQAQLNYYNALYQVLASKLDLQRALGEIRVN